MNYFLSNIQFLCKQRRLSTSQLAGICLVEEKLLVQAMKNTIPVTLPLLLSLADAFNMSMDTLVKIDLKTKHAKAENIKLLVIDIDGVLTDGGMYYTERGDELKKFNTKDGLAIRRLVKEGMQVAFLSNGINVSLINSRARLLGVQHVYVGLEEKTIALDKWVKKLKIAYKNVAYIGDDINDIQVIQKAGFSACPADATEQIKQAVNVILSRKGGSACVRELIDNYF